MMDRAIKRETQRRYAKTDISRSIVHDPHADGHLKIDRRTRKTKDALRNAVFALIAEKGYDDVTVQDIIDRADVGRSTFYTHFTDKHDAFRSGFDTLCDVLQRRIRIRENTGTLFAFSVEIYRHFHEPRMRALYLAIKDHASGTMSLQWLTNLVTQLVRLDLPKLPARPRYIPEEALQNFVVSAYLGLLTWSLELPAPPDPWKLDEMFRALVLPGLKARGISQRC